MVEFAALTVADILSPISKFTMAGLDPATQRVSVSERKESFAARTRGGWMAGPRAGHGEWVGMG